MKRKHKILIRFDDICPTMNYTQFEKALVLLKKYSIKPLLGIIPDCKDTDLLIEPYHEDFWNYMKKLKKEGYELAMHGYQHKYDSMCRGIVNMGYKSEFAGHSYEEQYEKIKKGKEILLSHGINTDIFFAPSHSYDKYTLQALAANGFHYVSDGRSKKMFRHCGILCLPCRSCSLSKIKNEAYYTAVFHAHEWVKPNKAVGYKTLQRICETYSDNIVDFANYKEQELGNTVIQNINEKVDVFYERNIHPMLSKWKHYIYQ